MTGRVKTIIAISIATIAMAGCSKSASGGGGNTTSGGANTIVYANPAKPGPSQKLHLIWRKTTQDWRVKYNDGSEEEPSKAEIKLEKGVGPTMFEVDIQGAGSQNIAFDDSGPLSVWTGTKDSPKSGINSNQILNPPTIDKHGNLTFWDLNEGDPVTLYYSLHFKNGVPSVDPIVDNGGGGNVQ